MVPIHARQRLRRGGFRPKVKGVTILVLRAGDPVEPVAVRRGAFSDWIAATVGDVWRGGWAVHDVRDSDPLPRPEDYAAFVITGSSSSVTEHAPWMLRTIDLIVRIVRANKPLLGICFGHQLMAEAFGGLVTKNPRGREIGTVRAQRLADDALFDGLGASFEVNATHVDSVARVPADARVLASTSLDPVAAFAVGDRARAVQFHPEIDADVMRGYIDARMPAILAEGLDGPGIRSAVRETPDGQRLLKNFVRKFVL
jgi:GMP synthase (glutamine-hydrolysing)